MCDRNASHATQALGRRPRSDDVTDMNTQTIWIQKFDPDVLSLAEVEVMAQL